MPLAALIRAAADGEISPADRERLEAELSEARVDERVAFERALRESVREHMTGPAAPAGLRERITDAMAAATAVAAVDENETMHSRSAGGVGDARLTRDRRWWASPLVATLGRWGAVAAVLAIAATLIFNASRSTVTASPYSPEEASQLVSFIGRQHDACKDFNETWERKMKFQSPEAAQAAAAEILQIAPDAFHFREPLTRKGYEFAGLGRCAVPGGDHSVHLIYKRPSDGAAVSLFIQTNARTKLPSSCCLVDKCQAPECAIWQDGPVRYYVFSEKVDAVAEVMDAFNVKRRHEELAPAR